MKAKNVILGILALTFAIGSALATVNSFDEKAYLSVRTVSEPMECREVAQCDNQTGPTCTATVSGINLINPGSHSLLEEDCPSELTHSSGVIDPIQVEDDVLEIL